MHPISLYKVLIAVAAFLVAISYSTPLFADMASGDPATRPSLPPITLFPQGAPGALGHRDADIPTLTAYIPHSPDKSGVAVVICPGGGFRYLDQTEGADYAVFLNQHGVSAFVLKYRLVTDGYQRRDIFPDAVRAMRWVRANAAQYGVNPGRIGIVGSSAGGNLAAMLLTRFDAGDAKASDPIERASSRPDFGVLCYAVIPMGDNGRAGGPETRPQRDASERRGRPAPDPVQVTDQTPPCFIFHTWEDNRVRVDGSLNFAMALRLHHVPFDLHIYQKGGHGMGLGDTYPYAHAHPWTGDLLYWLKAQGLLSPAASTQPAP